MVHWWSEDERTTIHLLFHEYRLNPTDTQRIFQHLFPLGFTANRIRDEYNSRNNQGRSRIWREKIVKADSQYTTAEQTTRQRLRIAIQNAAQAVGINLSTANAPQQVRMGVAVLGNAGQQQQMFQPQSVAPPPPPPPAAMANADYYSMRPPTMPAQVTSRFRHYGGHFPPSNPGTPIHIPLFIPNRLADLVPGHKVYMQGFIDHPGPRVMDPRLNPLNPSNYPDAHQTQQQQGVQGGQGTSGRGGPGEVI